MMSSKCDVHAGKHWGKVCDMVAGMISQECSRTITHFALLSAHVVEEKLHANYSADVCALHVHAQHT